MPSSGAVGSGSSHRKSFRPANATQDTIINDFPDISPIAASRMLRQSWIGMSQIIFSRCPLVKTPHEWKW